MSSVGSISLAARTALSVSVSASLSAVGCSVDVTKYGGPDALKSESKTVTAPPSDDAGVGMCVMYGLDAGGSAANQWTTQVHPMLLQKCSAAGCHDGQAGSHPPVINSDAAATYADLSGTVLKNDTLKRRYIQKANPFASSIVCNLLVDGNNDQQYPRCEATMPVGTRLTAVDMHKVCAWLASGAGSE